MRSSFLGFLSTSLFLVWGSRVTAKLNLPSDVLYLRNRILLFAAYAYGVNSTIRHVVAYLCRINYIKSADYIFHLVPTKDQACCTICVVFWVCSVALNEVIDGIYRWPCSTSRFRFSVLIGRYRFGSRDIENALSNFQLRTFSSIWARTLNRALIWL